MKSSVFLFIECAINGYRLGGLGRFLFFAVRIPRTGRGLCSCCSILFSFRFNFRTLPLLPTWHTRTLHELERQTWCNTIHRACNIHSYRSFVLQEHLGYLLVDMLLAS
jgi:hypothetical protein